MNAVTDRIGSIVALFEGIGGQIFVPVVALSLMLGILAGRRLGASVRIALVAASLVGFVTWSNLFVVQYRNTPSETVYIIKGWDLTEAAARYLAETGAPADLSAAHRDEELLKVFGRNPDVIWTAGGLQASRLAGTAAMALVTICLGALLSGVTRPGSPRSARSPG